MRGLVAHYTIVNCSGVHTAQCINTNCFIMHLVHFGSVQVCTVCTHIQRSYVHITHFKVENLSQKNWFICAHRTFLKCCPYHNYEVFMCSHCTILKCSVIHIAQLWNIQRCTPHCVQLLSVLLCTFQTYKVFKCVQYTPMKCS